MSIACVIQVTSLPLRKSTGIAQLQVHPLITHTLVQMLKVKRLGLGKYAVKLETLFTLLSKRPRPFSTYSSQKDLRNRQAITRFTFKIYTAVSIDLLRSPINSRPH